MVYFHIGCAYIYLFIYLFIYLSQAMWGHSGGSNDSIEDQHEMWPRPGGLFVNDWRSYSVKLWRRANSAKDWAEEAAGACERVGTDRARWPLRDPSSPLNPARLRWSHSTVIQSKWCALASSLSWWWWWCCMQLYWVFVELLVDTGNDFTLTVRM